MFCKRVRKHLISKNLVFTLVFKSAQEFEKKEFTNLHFMAERKRVLKALMSLGLAQEKE
jgi:hypothetical protein